MNQGLVRRKESPEYAYIYRTFHLVCMNGLLVYGNLLCFILLELHLGLASSVAVTFLLLI